MREEEIQRSYEDIKKTADKALQDAAERNRHADTVEEIVGFVFTVLVAFGWMMLMLILISFVGLAYIHLKLEKMIIWSILFAVAVGVIEAFGLIKKHKRKKQ